MMFLLLFLPVISLSDIKVDKKIMRCDFDFDKVISLKRFGKLKAHGTLRTTGPWASPHVVARLRFDIITDEKIFQNYQTKNRDA